MIINCAFNEKAYNNISHFIGYTTIKSKMLTYSISEYSMYYEQHITLLLGNSETINYIYMNHTR